MLRVVGLVRLGCLEGRWRGKLCLRRGWSELLLLLAVNLLTTLHNLGNLLRGLRCVWVTLGLRGASRVLDVLEVLALVRLKCWRRGVMDLRLPLRLLRRRLGGLLLRLCLCLLLLLLVRVVILLLTGVVLLVELSVAAKRARGALRVKRLILVRVLRIGDGRVVALVLLLRWVLLLVFWDVIYYPALTTPIASLRAHAVKWGPIVWGAGRKLRRMALVLRVFGRYLGRRLVFLLQEWIEVVLVLLVGGREMRAGSLPLV